MTSTPSPADGAHARGFPVINVIVRFRPGAPEASPRFKALQDKAIDPRPLITPGANDLVDLCADGDEEVHRVLTTKVFPSQATVVTSEEWMEALLAVTIHCLA